MFIADLLQKVIYAKIDEEDTEDTSYRIEENPHWFAECPCCLGLVNLYLDKDYYEEDDYVVLLP
jgi:hypothetical protein